MHKINTISSLGGDKFGKETGPHNHFISPEGRFPIKPWVTYISTCKALLEMMPSSPMKPNRACAVRVEIKGAVELLRRCLKIWPLHFMQEGDWSLSIERARILPFLCNEVILATLLLSVHLYINGFWSLLFYGGANEGDGMPGKSSTSGGMESIMMKSSVALISSIITRKHPTSKNVNLRKMFVDKTHETPETCLPHPHNEPYCWGLKRKHSKGSFVIWKLNHIAFKNSHL